MDPAVMWTAVSSVAGVAAVVVAGWQVRIGIADHRLRRAAAQRDIKAAGGSTSVGHRQLDESRQPVRLPPRPAVLAGREDLLAELHSRLTNGPQPQTIALCGLGGAGKTSAAAEYAHRHLAEVVVCWQFPAEEPVELEADFAVLAAELGVRSPGDVRDPIASVHSALARQEADWLMIFDNAPDRASVERFLPPTGPGRILITTQSQHWPPGQAIEVSALNTATAARFLASRTGSGDRAAALDLAAELGGLPLALGQAAAYMRATGIGMRAYLELFRARQADLLARGEAAGHPAHVAATLGLALSELGDQTPAALGLIRLLAFLAPEPVPIGLLLSDPSAAAGLSLDDVPGEIAPLLGDPVACGDAVAALRRYSLVVPAGDGTVLVHRLVRAVTRAALTAEYASRWEQSAAALVERAVPADTETPEAWPTCALLLPHARAALDLTSSGMTRIASFLGESGNHAAARDLYRRVAEAQEGSLGSEHPKTLTARASMAHWTGWAGDLAAARDQYAALLPAMERVNGPEHPETLTARDGLAAWTGFTGNSAAARDQYAALLPIYERVLGPEHPDTLNVRASLARWTGNAGDAAAARDQFAALLPIRIRVSGPEHPATLTVRNFLAKWTGNGGDATAARDQYAALLPIYERVLGPEHPDTLSVRDGLARWNGNAGDAAAARDQYASLLPIYERAYAPEHPGLISVRSSLAHWNGKTGDIAAARDQHAALIPIYERAYGPEHPETLNARAHLAYWSRQTDGQAVDAPPRLPRSW